MRQQDAEQCEGEKERRQADIAEAPAAFRTSKETVDFA